MAELDDLREPRAAPVIGFDALSVKVSLWRAAAWAVIMAVGLTGCADAPTAVEATPGTEYLEAALDILETNSRHKYEVDWSRLRSTVWKDAGTLNEPADAYGAIRNALDLVGDQHSFLLTPAEVHQRVSCVNPPPYVRVAPNLSETATPVGYMRVGSAVCPGSSELAAAYQRAIEGVDTTGVCGWIVDLRGNGGGNIAPMIGGVGPIVGEGVLGYFVGPDSTKPWAYRNGAVLVGENAVATVADPYELRDPAPPVVVLVDGVTASAAEATYLSFVGRPNTHTIGGWTAGFSTANTAFLLSDSAVLAVTTAVMADRTGQIYGGYIVPERVAGGDGSLNPETDRAYRYALEWLAERQSCASP